MPPAARAALMAILSMGCRLAPAAAGLEKVAIEIVQRANKDAGALQAHANKAAIFPRTPGFCCPSRETVQTSGPAFGGAKLCVFQI